MSGLEIIHEKFLACTRHSISSTFFFFSTLFGCTESLLLRVGFLQLWQVGATLQLWCTDFSLQWLLLLESTGRGSSAVVAHGLSRPVACGIVPNQGLNLCPLRCKVDSFFLQGGFLTTGPPGKSKQHLFLLLLQKLEQ